MNRNMKAEQALMTELWDPALADNPDRFVMFVYPWGKEGTPLARFKGPRTWQRDHLAEMADHIRANRERMAEGLPPKVWQAAKSSGRGIGKSALVAWRDHWFRSVCLGGTSIVTANNEAQLKTRTFAEITKWLTMAVNSHWFQSTVLSVKPAPWFDQALKEQLKIDTGYYYSQGQLWSEETPDAFAGVHNPLGVMLTMDEASGIPTPIWNVSEGFFTEPELHRYWDVFSNPRRNSGAFFDAFHDHKEFWRLAQIDARTVENTDPAVYDRIIKKHGPDSDVARVEVYGQFPAQGFRQFISSAVVEAAQEREIDTDNGAALVIGVDIARYGDDTTVFRFRQGRDARSIPPVRLKGAGTVEVCNALAEWVDKVNPDAVNIDAGNGQGVIDVMRDRKYRVNEIWFGSSSSSPEWANKRTEMYAAVRDWLKGGAIDNDAALKRDLTAPEYHYFGKAQDAIMLESKEDMKSRGLPSPDDGDALALTFAVPVSRRDSRTGRSRRSRMAEGVDGSVFG